MAVASTELDTWRTSFKHDNNFTLMSVGFVIMRIPQILLWFKVAYDDKSSRELALRYAISIFIFQLFWCYFVFFNPNWYAFVLLMIFEIVAPYFAEIKSGDHVNTKYHPHHIEERLGLLTNYCFG